MHKAFGTMTSMCYFCRERVESGWNFCKECGYPLKKSPECLSTQAPHVLIEFAKQWHTGNLTALYKVQEDRRILHRNLLLLTQELKAILNDSRDGPSTREEIEGHLHALEYLYGQQ